MQFKDDPMKKLALAMFVALTTLFMCNSWASEANPPEKTLDVNGSIYHNTCLPKPLGKLKNTIESNRSNSLNASKAWSLINTLLCAQASESNIELVLKKLSSKVSVEEPAATGGTEKPKLIPRSKELAESLMAKGFAWDASVTFRKDSVRINYLSDGTCGKSFRLKLISTVWVLVSSSEICD
jgi:hypothetical protein